MLDTYIGRVIAFVLTPILLPTATAVAAWLQNVVGIDLTGDALTAYVVAVAAGLALTVATWLRNRGAWEVAVATAAGLHAQGTTYTKAPVEPTLPPGIGGSA